MVRKRTLIASSVAGALGTIALVGSLTMGAAFAATPTPTAAPAGQVSSGQTEQPASPGSVAAPKTETTGGDAAEAAALQSLAKITPDQAKTAALGKFPGATVKKVSLDDENGSVVYSVDLTDTAGKSQDVKIDAGNGAILAVDSEGTEGSGTPEAADSAESTSVN